MLKKNIAFEPFLKQQISFFCATCHISRLQSPWTKHQQRTQRTNSNSQRYTDGRTNRIQNKHARHLHAHTNLARHPTNRSHKHKNHHKHHDQRRKMGQTHRHNALKT